MLAGLTTLTWAALPRPGVGKGRDSANDNGIKMGNS